MTSSPTVQHIPLRWLLLDLVGLVLVGLGFAVSLERLSVSPPLPPGPVWGPLLIIAGLACMLPLIWKIRRAIQRANRQDEAWLASLPPETAERLRRRSGQ